MKRLFAAIAWYTRTILLVMAILFLLTISFLTALDCSLDGERHQEPNHNQTTYGGSF